MDENEINKDAGKGPKLGGTADKHIRPCQIDGIFRRYLRTILHHDNLKMDIGLLAKA